MFSQRTLWCDFETGGFEAGKHSPLSVAFIAADGRNIIGKWETQIRQEPFVVTAEAMRINGLDLKEPGLTFEQFKYDYKARLAMWFYGGLDKSAQPVIKPTRDSMPMFGGQNCPFDRAFLQDIMGKWDWVSFRSRDLMQLAMGANDAGLLDCPDFKLDSIGIALGLGGQGEVHSASRDIQLTFDCWWKLIDLIKK